MTVATIEADGFEIAERVDVMVGGDDAGAISKSMALGLVGFSDVFQRLEPDCILVLGDRYEMFSAVIAALPLNIPVGHIHGGELTIGAFDDSIRHSITKLSHLHFVSTADAAARVRQLGEPPERIFLVGAPALDNLETLQLPEREAFLRSLGLPLDTAPVLATFHPVTRDLAPAADLVRPMLEVLMDLDAPIVFTAPNADPGGQAIRATLRDFVERHERAVLLESLGPVAYFALMRDAAFMIGNSSSGIIEAGSFGLPVVDIGDRQSGRVRGGNVVHCVNERSAIADAVSIVRGEAFREQARSAENPYYAGGVALKIADVLENMESQKELVLKPFIDMPARNVAHC
jgi:UDP-hydrolysing UDP-N-acetyl-D-glucosamine 2-epimerase